MLHQERMVLVLVYYSKKIMEDHNGTLEVKNIEGSIEFALIYNLLVKKKQIRDNIINTMKYNVLVIDDEEDIRNSIAGLLEDENYEVRTVENSDKALNAISERLPDLILIDIWLENSKLDGLELLNEIQTKFLSLPCVMISGHGIDIAVKAIRSGASDYIEKPFEAERLLITSREF